MPQTHRGIFVPNYFYTALFIFFVSLAVLLTINVTSCNGLSLNQMVMKATKDSPASCKSPLRYTALISAITSCIATLFIAYAVFAGDPRNPLVQSSRRRR